MTDKCNCSENDTCEVEDTLVDFVTGGSVPDTFAERIRQKTERFLVENKKYSKSDIEVGVEFEIVSGQEAFSPRADLIIRLGRKRVIIIKCIYGALTAGERLVISYARLLDSYQIPYAVVTNWEDTEVLDTISGKVIGSGLDAIPKKDELNVNEIKFREFPNEKVEREKRVLAAFESIDDATCPNIGG
jgi:hypothetical protein